jgi:hypothetical protein
MALDGRDVEHPQSARWLWQARSAIVHALPHARDALTAATDRNGKPARLPEREASISAA